jgi:hypothetical protein
MENIDKLRNYYKKNLQELINKTDFLNHNPSFKERFYCLINNIRSIPLCPNCLTNNSVWYETTRQYSYCSKKCLYEGIGKNSIKNKEQITKKIEETNLKKYGVKNVNDNQECKNKRLLKIREKHGKDFYFQTDEFKNKRNQTMKDLYGTIIPLRNESIKKKFVETSIKNHGSHHPLSSKDLRKTFKKSEITEERKQEIKQILKISKERIFREKYKNEYEVLEYNDILKLKSLKCSHSFEINRLLFHLRTTRNHPICTKCNPLNINKSICHDEICDYISSLGIDLEKNNRTILNGKELDIFIPEHDFAIEYNGLYWHSSLFRPRKYHQDKSLFCRDKNIKLIHIWEDDWKDKKEIVKSIIKNNLNITRNKIFARKTEIKIIDNPKEESLFLKENHLQSYNSSTICYGLYCNDELVQLMSFIKKKDYWEIQRLCTKLDYQIIGGTEKLWKHFLKENNPNKVITYSSIDYFTGKIYEKLGMKLNKITEPSLFYTDGKIKINRQSFQKHKVNKKGLKSTLEIIYEMGFFPLYNSGNLKFSYSDK